MERFKFLQKDELNPLPTTAGVYCFKHGKKLLYIGKAANIKERVKNHFQQPTYRDNLFINQVEKLGFIETDSEIEALLLESELIKKYRPKYNILWKDDKSYFFVAVTKDGLPRVFITHQPNPKPYTLKPKFIGPFVDGNALKRVLRFLRRVFPYYVAKKHPKIPCSWCHLDLCPGPDPDKNDYKKNIKNLIAVLKGKKKSVLRALKKEMAASSQKQDFEKAAKLRDQIQSLENVFSHAEILRQKMVPRTSTWYHLAVEETLKKILGSGKKIERIEAYDVSNIQGKEATGSMVTFVNGEPDKNFYRKFKIHIAGKPNDTAMLKETLTRRFNHPEWPLPDLILIDGGKGQLNAALAALKPITCNLKPKTTALAKSHNELFIESKKNPVLLKNLPQEISNLILRLRDEAHRFAISYHKKLREKEIFG